MYKFTISKREGKNIRLDKTSYAIVALYAKEKEITLQEGLFLLVKRGVLSDKKFTQNLRKELAKLNL